MVAAVGGSSCGDKEERLLRLGMRGWQRDAKRSMSHVAGANGLGLMSLLSQAGGASGRWARKRGQREEEEKGESSGIEEETKKMRGCSP